MAEVFFPTRNSIVNVLFLDVSVAVASLLRRAAPALDPRQFLEGKVTARPLPSCAFAHCAGGCIGPPPPTTLRPCPLAFPATLSPLPEDPHLASEEMPGQNPCPALPSLGSGPLLSLSSLSPPGPLSPAPLLWSLSSLGCFSHLKANRKTGLILP